jgi:hypothetical protein
MASDAELRSALEWESGRPQPQDKNVFEWLWQAVQGDFDDNRSTGQIAFDTAISMIPVVDQICDVRDIIANSRAIATSEADEDTSWKWVALVLTLIGLFPSLGSLVKGVLKLFFVFVRRHGLNKVTAAVDEAMTWVITYLRKREVQKLLRQLKVDEVFKWLAEQVKTVRGQVNTGAVLQAFDKGIGVMKGLLGKVADLPIVGQRAKATIEMVDKVRRGADQHIGQALAPVKTVLDKIIHRLEMESLVQRSGILDARSVHFRGTLPEARAVTLMRQADPPPPWLSKGREGKWAEQKLAKGREQVAAARKEDPTVPELNEKNIKSFHTMAVVEIKGPAKLYRVTSPSNGAMGDCWVPEEVWRKITQAPDPKAAWRKYCAVWPDWNPNGQFVVLEIPAGQSLKAWRGPASSQAKLDHPDMKSHLEGGWDQIVVKVDPGHFDTTRYYMRGGGHGETLRPPGLSRQEWEKLSRSKREAYTAMRERINHPSIKGPLDTGWGSTDFDPQLRDARIGLPALPGQITN